jgi:hypothetical protein
MIDFSAEIQLLEFLFHFAVAGTIMYFAMKWINNKFKLPDEGDWNTSDTAFLAMCCRRAQLNVGQIFTIAAERHGVSLTEGMVRKDVSLFLRESRIPFYVQSFIQEGRQAMRKENDE